MFIAIGVYGWGRGRTKAAALRNMRNNVSAANRDKYILYEVEDPDATVTWLGDIFTKTEPREIERKGIPADAKMASGPPPPDGAGRAMGGPTTMGAGRSGMEFEEDGVGADPHPNGDPYDSDPPDPDGDMAAQLEDDGEGHDQLAEDLATYNRTVADGLSGRMR